jgi:steroid delta-isomerase-like uncharacterized protein
MSAENKALIRRWFEEVWNKGRVAAIDEMFHSEGVAHGLGDGPEAKLHGPNGFKPFFQSFYSTFPDINVTIDRIISEGDLVAAHCTVRGTHTGNGLGVEATQKPIQFTGLTMARIKDGKIIEAWNNFDFQALFQQIGMK